jgi:Ca2+/Na+ antiporter
MKKETFKEFGKLLYDFAKIGFAIIIITPLAKGEKISFIAVAMVLVVIALATYIINRGAKDE